MFPTNVIAKYIDACESEVRDTHSQPSVLPVLGTTPPALFVQICHLTWWSRQLPLDHAEHHRSAVQCVTELKRIQKLYPHVGAEDVAPIHGDGRSGLRNSEISAKLYFLATQMFAAKVLDPNEVNSASSQIQAQLRMGGTLLEMFDTSVPCGQFLCWPLLVLGCAACPTNFYEAAQDLPSEDDELDRWQMRALIHEMLLQIWSVSFSGYVQRTLGALKKIWCLPLILERAPSSDNVSDNGVDYDGLNALIHKDGLGATFLLSDGG